MDLTGKTILVTGGTGLLRHAFPGRRAARARAAAPCASSAATSSSSPSCSAASRTTTRLRYLLGDVRDLPRLTRATRGVDVIVHAAALKQVPAAEYNPFEAVQTNVVGAENVVAAAIDNDVPLTISLSTDKAVNPVNLYGATKLCAEKIVTQGNAYAADSPARFATVRYGNVVGSRGSVVPLFKAQAETGVLTITDERMTRFWITLDQAVRFVLGCLDSAGGGEVFVPKIPSMRVTDIAEALAPDAERRVIGIRPGEKLHELLVTEDESRHSYELRRSLRDPARVRVVAAARGRGRNPHGRGLPLLPATPTRAGSESTSSPRWPRASRPWREASCPTGVRRSPTRTWRRSSTALRGRPDHPGPARGRASSARWPTTWARPRGVAFSSGTAALHAAAFAAGVGPGDEVITTPITFAASANCALYLGARRALRGHRPRHLEPRHRGRRGDGVASELGRSCP